MSTNNLYRILTDEKTLKAIKEIEFKDFNFRERYDIQEWVESNPEILGEKLLIISKDLTFFSNTKERPDLIAIDTNGDIVIIELKRDDSGLNVEWQAIKYASYLSKFTVNDIFNLYEKYLSKYQNEQDFDQGVIEQRILEFIDEEDFIDLNKNQRIILVSHRFAKEVTSAAYWLIDKYNMNIKCVQIIPFYDKDKNAYYLQTTTILPVPGAEELLIRASEKVTGASNTPGTIKKDDEVTRTCNEIYNKLQVKLLANTPDKKSRWAGVANKFRYFHLWYSSPLWDNWGLGYRIWFYSGHPSYGNKIGIYFEYNRNYLLQNSVDESTLLDLETFLKKENVEGFKYYEKNVGRGLEVYVDEQEGITEKLESLINQTKESIENILGILNT